MGGIAFNKPVSPYNLNTPRMPRAVYQRVRDRCHALLRRRFLAVASPIEAPRKPDYGDVDIFVAWDTQAHTAQEAAYLAEEQRREEGCQGRDAGADPPWIVDFEDGLRLMEPAAGLPLSDPSPAERAMLRAVGELLGAVYARLEGLVNVSAQYAILWPEDEACPVDTDESAVEEPRYIQIDLHIYGTIEEFHWALFYYAHGDLTPIFQNMLRPFNLDMSHEGLYLRMPELGDDQTVLITREPGQVLRLLGYAPISEAWTTEFESVAALFELAAQCRFFTGFAGIELKEQDNQIILYREIFRTWVRDFVPTYDSEKCAGVGLCPDAVREEIFHFFPGVRLDHEIETLRFHEANQKDLFCRIIKPAIPISEDTGESSAWRRFAETAFREIIMQDDYSLGVKPTRPLRSSHGLYIVREIQRFISKTWREVGDAAWRRYYGPGGQYQQHLKRQTVEEREEAERKRIAAIEW